MYAYLIPNAFSKLVITEYIFMFLCLFTVLLLNNWRYKSDIVSGSIYLHYHAASLFVACIIYCIITL